MRPLRFVAVAALAVAPALSAQSLAERVLAGGDGMAVFSYASRAEVCGDGERSVRVGRSWMGYAGDERPCVHGPVQVRLTVRDGAVQRLESWVGATRERDGRALGSVPAGDAARYLLGLTQAGSAVGARAIAPAAFADSAVVWPALLGIARDSTAPRAAARREAAFWLSRFAEAAIGGHPNTLSEDDEEDADDVKLQAVFVLSQLRNREGIPPLLDVVRSQAALPVRQRALFWLGQSGDPRALTLFESLLRG